MNFMILKNEFSIACIFLRHTRMIINFIFFFFHLKFFFFISFWTVSDNLSECFSLFLDQIYLFIHYQSVWIDCLFEIHYYPFRIETLKITALFFYYFFQRKIETFTVLFTGVRNRKFPGTKRKILLNKNNNNNNRISQLTFCRFFFPSKKQATNEPERDRFFW